MWTEEAMLVVGGYCSCLFTDDFPQSLDRIPSQTWEAHLQHSPNDCID